MHRVYVLDLGRKFLYLQWTDPATGGKRKRSAKTAKRREAERKAKELEDVLNEHLLPADGSVAWDVFVDRYQHQHLQSLAGKSETKSLGVLDSVARHCKIGRLNQLTASSLSWYAGQLRSEGLSESTIAGHVRTIRAALSWALDNGLISRVPQMPRVARVKSQKSRGRPITVSEFARMLRAARGVVGVPARRSWCRLLRGLWQSGLRLGEAVELRWVPGPWPWIDWTGDGWWLVIPQECDKAHEERRLPVVPDWRRLLDRVPAADRQGYVWNPLGERGRRVKFFRVIQIVAEIGKAAGVIVDRSTGRTATAHDLRRSFAQRWASRLSPIDLQRIMRHADISTTSQYYLDSDSDGLAKRLGATLGTTDH